MNDSGDGDAMNELCHDVNQLITKGICTGDVRELAFTCVRSISFASTKTVFAIISDAEQTDMKRH